MPPLRHLWFHLTPLVLMSWYKRTIVRSFVRHWTKHKTMQSIRSYGLKFLAVLWFNWSVKANRAVTEKETLHQEHSSQLFSPECSLRWYEMERDRKRKRMKKWRRIGYIRSISFEWNLRHVNSWTHGNWWQMQRYSINSSFVVFFLFIDRRIWSALTLFNFRDDVSSIFVFHQYS